MKRLGNGGKVLLGLAVAVMLLVIAELALVLVDAVPQDAYVLKPGIRWTVASNLKGKAVQDGRGGSTFALTTDDNGLRVAGPARPDAAIKILVLGDSVVFGWNLPDDQTMPARLQHHLDRLAGPGATWVINGGQPGFSSVQSLYMLEHLGPSYQPDLVLAQFSMHDTKPALETDLEQLGARFSVGSLDTYLAHSRLYRLLRLTALEIREPAQSGASPGGIDHSLTRDPPRPAEPGAPEPVLNYEKGVRVPVADFGKVLGGFNGLAAERRFSLVWTLAFTDRLPLQYAELFDVGREERAGRFARQATYMRKLDPAPPLHLEHDPGHWNQTGSDLVGEALARFLVKQGLVPGRPAPVN